MHAQKTHLDARFTHDLTLDPHLDARKVHSFDPPI